MKFLIFIVLILSAFAAYGQQRVETIPPPKDTIGYTTLPNVIEIKVGKVYVESETSFPESTFEFGDINYYSAIRASSYLDLPAYDSLGVGELADSSVLHPDIIDTRKSWNGYRYWMTYTPLPEVRPDGNENPHIVASNDLVTWVEPNGIGNPIKKGPPSTSYNSDPDLYFENDTLYCLYRTWTNLPGPGNRAIVEMKRSSNGTTWNDSTELIDYTGGANNRIVSPSIIKDGNYYYLYCVNVNASVNTAFVERWRSSSILTGWSAYDSCSVSFTNCFLPDTTAATTYNFRMWHVNVNKIGSKHILTIYTRTDVFRQLFAAQNVWLASATDGKTFTAAKYPLFLKDYDSEINNNTGNNWWDLGLYRASILPVSDSINLYYSGWKGEYEDYPDFIGRTAIDSVDPEIILGKPYNTVSAAREAQLLTAHAGLPYAFSDSINRADNENINPSSCGENYTVRLGKFDIKDNYLIKDTTINSLIEINPDSVNYECIMNLQFNQSGFTSEASDFRIYMKATAYNGYTVDVSNGSNNSIILRCVTTATVIVDRKTRNYINLTDLNSLKFRVVGNNFKVWINGILYFDHDLTLADASNNQTNYNNLLASKRICLFQPTTVKSLKIKNITIKNLNSQGL